MENSNLYGEPTSLGINNAIEYSKNYKMKASRSIADQVPEESASMSCKIYKTEYLPLNVDTERLKANEIQENAENSKIQPMKRNRRRHKKKDSEELKANEIQETAENSEMQQKKRNRRRHRKTNSDGLVSYNINKHISEHNKDLLELQSLFFHVNELTLSSDNSTLKKQTNNVSKKDVKSSPSKSSSNDKNHYENYLSKEEVLLGLRDKILLEGSLRVNAKCFQQAYISNPNKTQSDILINGVKDRNRALNDDLVIVQLYSPEEWFNNKPTGKIVFIKERRNSLMCIGYLKLNPGKKTEATFYPRDKRFPILYIPLIDCPPYFEKEHRLYENSLFCAKILTWCNTKYTIGTLLSNVGQANDLKTQTKVILLENELDVTPFGPEFKHLYPGEDYCIPKEEFKYREDFRNICVFTIDPLTARDLDDAVSCKVLDSGNYEIGVHISDVAFYLTEGTALDERVAQKATTVYLVDGTYHMLPKELCFHCSLLPGKDKLAFSVLWEITPSGEIISHRFTRSIINSCCQLAYEHVQEMLDNPKKTFSEGELPPIAGKWNITDIKSIVNKLFKLSVIFQSKRFQGGALRIDQPKLHFKLDPTNGFPLSYEVDERNASHSLIEEFMLLANCTVAERIFNDFPELAFLRLHPPPKNTLEAVAENFSRLGYHLDISSAGHLQTSLAKVMSGCVNNKAKGLVLHAQLVKTLSRAVYFCAYGHDDDDMKHYALNIPLYTHFTSPIRRYADIIVHRLLSSTLGYTPNPTWNPQYVQGIANNCNKQKLSAKRAGDMSAEVYLYKYISILSPLKEVAAIMDVYENSLEVIVLSTGLVKRIPYDHLSKGTFETSFIRSVKEGQANKVVVRWINPDISLILQIFDEVKVEIEKTNDLMTINMRILPPEVI